MTAVIETEKLTKSYGAHRGIIEVDLTVDEGEAFGFLGPERRRQDDDDPDPARPHPADQRARAASSASRRPRPGRDPSTDRLPARRVHALRQADRRPDHRVLRQPARRRRPGLPGDLIARLDVDPTRKFREYSKGNKQKIGLVIALQHRPDLLILDEPTSGLDPLVQQTFYERHPRGEGGGPDGLPVEPHPVRGREDLRPGRDHPRRPPGPGRSGRGAARPRPPPGRAPLRRARSRSPRSRRCPASAMSPPRTTLLRMRVSGSITPVVRAAAQLRAARLRQPRAVARGDVPRRVRPAAGRGGLT